jgi:hypothetical protein
LDGGKISLLSQRNTTGEPEKRLVGGQPKFDAKRRIRPYCAPAEARHDSRPAKDTPQISSDCRICWRQ